MSQQELHLVAQRLEIEAQVFDHLVPLLSILPQGLADDALQLRGQPRIEPRERLRLAIENRDHDVAAARAAERPPS